MSASRAGTFDAGGFAAAAVATSALAALVSVASVALPSRTAGAGRGVIATKGRGGAMLGAGIGAPETVAGLRAGIEEGTDLVKGGLLDQKREQLLRPFP